MGLFSKSGRTGWSRLILGEKMPDKDDPAYAERRNKEVSMGRRVCTWLRLDKAVAAIQRFALKWPKAFLAIAFGIVIASFSLNVYKMGAIAMCQNEKVPVTKVQENKYKQLKIYKHETDTTTAQTH